MTELQFYPHDQWGLDYLFQSCNKMYIADILDMEYYPMFPGAFAYKNHPIYKVDILGVVVGVEERAKFFLYAVILTHLRSNNSCLCSVCSLLTVDDGTGVITAGCWKKTFGDQLEGSSAMQDIPAELTSTVTELNRLARERTVGYQLGDLVHMKGKIQVFRNRKEIFTFFHKKVDNPTYEVLRMIELPTLYKNHYDKVFTLPHKVAQEIKLREKEQKTGILSDTTVARQLRPVIKEFLTKSKLVEFCLLQLKANADLMSELIQLQGEGGNCDGVLQLVVSQMESDGEVSRLAGRTGQYEVLFQSCHLDEVILSILRRESTKPKCAEKGCHLLHVFDELKKTKQYSKLEKAGLMCCLERLESNSDVISTTSNHYLAS